ncbi:rod shape-determining protein [Ructibacterium gallinarum]|uniref:Cell shape-determining protein MreB n=1 Tax=Ructibacterium gallinarum TaxID=2779355 RepID=A0A9D5R890_9FIRM|nr:rod shape-determining protein MreB [Ructibacterium gallinarum]MBE5039219.1 rod shape-determining protein MreB [Ructibacterium gallinarum]
MLGQDIGIDLGTASILVYVRGRGIVAKEPSVVAVDKDSKRLLAVGSEAQKMLGRTPGNIVAVRPLREGVISDYTVTERMLRYFMQRVTKRGIFSSFFKPRVIICVPSGVTEVEERAVIDAGIQAGARKVHLIEEPLAAALGVGIDISQPCGSMVVDIGGGTSDIAVISLGGIVISRSIKVAGDNFDEAIIRYIRKKYNILIGERTAEELKIKIGCVRKRDKLLAMDIRGRSLVSGLPKTIQVSSDEIYEALTETAMTIVEEVRNVLEETPPELVGDISAGGIVLTGGGALIYGMDRLIQNETGIRAYVAEDAESCVAYGTGKALEHMEVLDSYHSADQREN